MLIAMQAIFLVFLKFAIPFVLVFVVFLTGWLGHAILTRRINQKYIQELNCLLEEKRIKRERFRHLNHVLEISYIDGLVDGLYGGVANDR